MVFDSLNKQNQSCSHPSPTALQCLLGVTPHCYKYMPFGNITENLSHLSVGRITHVNHAGLQYLCKMVSIIWALKIQLKIPKMVSASWDNITNLIRHHVPASNTMKHFQLQAANTFCVACQPIKSKLTLLALLFEQSLSESICYFE